MTKITMYQKISFLRLDDLARVGEGHMTCGLDHLFAFFPSVADDCTLAIPVTGSLA
jgi:hypothetical protein